ncbi:ornithine cyclodeaminase family protein [Bengtsoniella intestinalis]|uniref:ornithine cyclodeaminase family protein n=1 Tax=Bengtsoniella intestinalis TaxID=3073143 RepID=UPI00391EF55E
MEIKVLNAQDMGAVFTMSDAITATKDAMELYSAGQSNIPIRANLDIAQHAGKSLYMYGYAAPANALGVKIVSTYPNNIEKGLVSVPATMVLIDDSTGYVKAMMNGTFLTQIRTGAVVGMATQVLSREDSSVFALFGTGGQAITQLESVLTVRPIKLVKVFDINVERAQAFASDMSTKFGEKFGVNIVAASSADEAIADADIITSVTTARNAVFNGKLVKKGAHINGVGSYLPEMSEIDEYIILNADKVFVDTRDGVLQECGDVIKPIDKGLYSADRLSGEIGEAIAGTVKGRESDDEITVFLTTGSAVLDLVTAERIYQKASEKGKGQTINL